MAQNLSGPDIHGEMVHVNSESRLEAMLFERQAGCLPGRNSPPPLRCFSWADRTAWCCYLVSGRTDYELRAQRLVLLAFRCNVYETWIALWLPSLKLQPRLEALVLLKCRRQGLIVVSVCNLLEYHPLSAVFDWLFNTPASSVHVWKPEDAVCCSGKLSRLLSGLVWR